MVICVTISIECHTLEALELPFSEPFADNFQGAINLFLYICMENAIQCNHSGPTDSGLDYWGAGVPQPWQKYPGSCQRRRGCPESDICLRNDQKPRHTKNRKKLDVCPPPQEHVRPRCHLRSLGGMGDEFRPVTIG